MNAALAPMKSYTGECVDGPYDGKRLTHWMTIKKFYATSSSFFQTSIVSEIGEYRFLDSRWKWFAKR